MVEAEWVTIRLRHYTRTSSKERILTDGRIVARDQNKVLCCHLCVLIQAIHELGIEPKFSRYRGYRGKQSATSVTVLQ